MSITPEAIKNLRESTGAGMMDCKKALTETNGNFEEAVDWLRKKGLSSAAKKAGRVASEGVIAVKTAGTRGAAVELNSETDFVARNEKFQDLASKIIEVALKSGSDVETLKAAAFPGTGRNVGDEVTNAVATIGENMNLRRSAVVEVSKGVVASYVHSAIAPGMGKIGILLGIESEGEASKLEALGKQLAMHIAAARPEALATTDVSTEKLDRERAVFKEQAIASGKTPEIAEKMVEGRVRKYYEEVVLLEQIFVVDGKTKISQVVADAAKEIGKPVKLTQFVRFQLGEGIEKQASDFAAEVAAAAGIAAA